MSAVLWCIAGWEAFAALCVVALVGKPRKPIEPSTAVLVVIINTLIIVGILHTGGVL